MKHLRVEEDGGGGGVTGSPMTGRVAEEVAMYS